MSDDVANPLATATIEELINELGGRTTGLLVVVEREMPGKVGENRYGTAVFWRHAGPVGALGLAEYAKLDIGRALMQLRGGIES